MSEYVRPRTRTARKAPAFAAVAAVLATLGAAFGGTADAVARAPRPAPDVYVAPSGDDRAPGTRTAPVRTPERARDLVRQRTDRLAADLTVHLAPGTYRLARPLVLDSRDSGGNGHRVVWQGSKGTVFSGGRAVQHWKPVKGRSGLWSAPAPAGLDNTRQLYVNGVRAQRARGPIPVTLKSTATGYTASADTLARWRNPSDIEFVYPSGEALWNIQQYGLGPWTEPRCPIGSMSGTTVTMAQPCWDNSTKRVEFPDIPGRSINMVGPGRLTGDALPGYVENAYEVLDQPGEWYLDRHTRTVYYRPRAGENPRTADVEAPVLEKLVDGRGTGSAPLHDIALRGIQFSYATWLTPSSSEGFSEVQAGYTVTGAEGWRTQGLCEYTPGGTCPYASWTRMPGNVAISHGRDLEFSDNAFVHLGAAGLELGTGTQNTTVRGNVFTDISGNGMEIGGVDAPRPGSDADLTRKVSVTDNHLYALPREYHGGVAILNGYTQNNTIAHNQIDHVGYSAISLGWGGWPDKIGKPATANVSHDNSVADNLIHDYMQALDDGAGVYTQGLTGSSLDNGEKITGNVIHDGWGLGRTIYTDNGCTYVTVEGNVLYGAQANVLSAHVDYRDNLGNNDPTRIVGNYWEQGDRDGNDKGVVTSGNHILADPSKAPAGIVAAAGLEPRYRGLLGRTFATRSVPEAPTRVGDFAADGSAYVTWNPSYVDGGSPVTSYTVTVTATNGAHTVSTTVPAARFKRTAYAVVDGLTNGTPYTVTVAARNRVGQSERSLAAAPVTPTADGSGALPAVSTGVKVNAEATAARLSWTPPKTTGDTPVIGYRITVSDGRTVTVTGRDVLVAQPRAKGMLRVIGKLRPSTAYTFSIAALTATGTGPSAEASVTTPSG
ncbi:fibronectin type III domain-containing protein [Streptomyces violaceusniger]|uniref:Fibronectin type III domain protein n=1 Tax=Streptomyces violaceusniger (strain Tu 4113) TaxID=653045 RepID=G2NWM7_STRV4|nr:fibronectin type III domain-containing protein [Streptomyces violaceusniger]AEM86984.1 Fibronectin type III domain protein [Streptomyces violaceusniger Tu 4113]